MQWARKVFWVWKIYLLIFHFWFFMQKLKNERAVKVEKFVLSNCGRTDLIAHNFNASDNATVTAIAKRAQSFHRPTTLASANVIFLLCSFWVSFQFSAFTFNEKKHQFMWEIAQRTPPNWARADETKLHTKETIIQEKIVAIFYSL